MEFPTKTVPQIFLTVFWYLTSAKENVPGVLPFWSSLPVKVPLLALGMKLTIFISQDIGALWQWQLATSTDISSPVISPQSADLTEGQGLMEGKSNMKNKLLLQLVSSLLWVPCGLSQFPDLPACLHVIGHRSGLLVSHNLPFSNPEKRKMFSLSQSNSCSLGPHFPSQDESLPSMENIHCLHGNPTPIYKNEI